MKIYTNKILVLIITFLSLSLSAIEDMSMELDLVPVDEPGGECDAWLLSKGWFTGDNVIGGKDVFMAVGSSGIKAPRGTPLYVDSIQNSYTEAALLARRDLAEFVGKKMSNDVKSQIIEGLSSGVKPKDLLAEQKIADDTGDISIFEKTKLLIHQKLDSMMSDETKDKLAQEEMSKEALQKELDEITDQASFEQGTETLAQAQIRGMKTINTILGKSGVCTVLAWSENTSKQADALASGNFELLKDLKPGKPLTRLVPNKSADGGLKKLLLSFGAHMERLDNGELAIISYGQAAASRAEPQALRAAYGVATEKAQAQIVQLSGENVDLYRKMDTAEVATGFDQSDIKDYYGDREFQERVSGSSKLQLSGLQTVQRWSIQKHPTAETPVAGVVMVWKPSSSDFAGRVKNVNESSGFGSKSSSSSSGSWYEENEMTGGSEASVDEDDF